MHGVPEHSMPKKRKIIATDCFKMLLAYTHFSKHGLSTQFFLIFWLILALKGSQKFLKCLTPEKVPFYRKTRFFNYKPLVFQLWCVLNTHLILVAVDKHEFNIFNKPLNGNLGNFYLSISFISVSVFSSLVYSLSCQPRGWLLKACLL